MPELLLRAQQTRELHEGAGPPEREQRQDQYAWNLPWRNARAGASSISALSMFAALRSDCSIVATCRTSAAVFALYSISDDVAAGTENIALTEFVPGTADGSIVSGGVGKKAIDAVNTPPNNALRLSSSRQAKRNFKVVLSSHAKASSSVPCIATVSSHATKLVTSMMGFSVAEFAPQLTQITRRRIALLHQMCHQRFMVAGKQTRDQTADHRSPYFGLTDQRAINQLPNIATQRDRAAFFETRQQGRHRGVLDAALTGQHISHIGSADFATLPQHGIGAACNSLSAISLFLDGIGILLQLPYYSCKKWLGKMHYFACHDSLYPQRARRAMCNAHVRFGILPTQSGAS